MSLGRTVYVAIESGLDKERVGDSGKALVTYMRYASTPFAQEVKRLYDDGGLDDVSVRWDWRTEEVRHPFEEEVQKYGEDLMWVCTHAELVEVSAVLLGADTGAQIIRSEVVEAFERCRSNKIALPLIERMIRECRPPMIAVGGKREPVDVNSAADAFDLAQTAASGLQDWQAGAAPLRQQISDGLTLLGNLSVSNENEGESEADEEPSDAAAAFGALNDALATFDLALRDVKPAIDAIDVALTQLAEALGLLVTEDGEGRKVLIDIDAVLADGQQPDSPAVRRLWEAYQKLNV